MAEMAIRAASLTRRFGTVRALEDLSVEIPRGTIFGLLGPNGAGKSTTIRLLLGLILPTAGRVEVLGRDPARHGEMVRRQVGVVLDRDGLYDRLTAEQNLEFAARIWHLSATERRQRIRDLLDRLGLWDRRRQPVVGFSRGMPNGWPWPGPCCTALPCSFSTSPLGVSIPWPSPESMTIWWGWFARREPPCC